MNRSSTKPIEKRGPFEIISRKVKYRNKWIKVTEDEVIKDGKHASYGVITTNNASTVLPIDDEGNIYLNKEFKYAVGKEIYTNCGGFIENNETRLEAAKRELKEETGITAEKLIYLGEILSYASICNSKYYLYIAKGLKFGKTKFDDLEDITLVKMSLNEAYKKVLSGEINYAPSVILILRARDLLKATD